MADKIEYETTETLRISNELNDSLVISFDIGDNGISVQCGGGIYMGKESVFAIQDFLNKHFSQKENPQLS